MANFYDDLALWSAPKTGSSWLAYVLQLSMGGGHQVVSAHTADGLEAFTGEVLTIVRHPVAWLESCYSWLVAKDWRQAFPGAAGVLRRYAANSADEFASLIPAGCVADIFAPYVARATTVLRTEHLRDDSERVLRRRGLTPRRMAWDVFKGQARNARCVAGWPDEMNVTDERRRVRLAPATAALVTERHSDFIERWYGPARIAGT